MAGGSFKLFVVDVSSIITRAVSSGSPGWQSGGGVTDQDFLNGMNSDTISNETDHFDPGDPLANISGSMSYGYSHSLPCISIDDGPLISFDDLPAGFKVVSAQATISVSSGVIGHNISSSPSVTINLISGTFKLGLFLTDTVTPDTFTSNFNGNFSFGVGDDLQIEYPEGTTISDMLSLGPQISIAGSVELVGSSPNPPSRYWQATLGVGTLSVQGIYEIELFQFQFSIDTESPVTPGDEIEVTSDPQAEHPLDFNDVTEVVINYKTTDNVDHTVTITQFLFQGPNSLIFILPDIGDAPTVEIKVTVDGTQFSGTVPLGTLLTIFFTNGTGIYRIVPGKINDTLYVQDYDPVETVDVKIPNPFFKTGFLPDA